VSNNQLDEDRDLLDAVVEGQDTIINEDILSKRIL